MIVTDDEMSDLGAMFMTKTLRQLLPNVPVIVLTRDARTDAVLKKSRSSPICSGASS